MDLETTGAHGADLCIIDTAPHFETGALAAARKKQPQLSAALQFDRPAAAKGCPSRRARPLAV